MCDAPIVKGGGYYYKKYDIPVGVMGVSQREYGFPPLGCHMC